MKDHAWEAIGFELPTDHSISGGYVWFKCTGCEKSMLTKIDWPVEMPTAPSGWELELEFIELDCNKSLCKMVMDE